MNSPVDFYAMIFVPTEDIDEDNTDYYELTSWGYTRTKHENVLLLSEPEFWLICKQNGIIEIINLINDSIFGNGEDGILSSNEVKLDIIVKLNLYYDEVAMETEKKILDKLIPIFYVSLKTNRSVFFRFP